jgi:hypothetical protein
MGPAVAEMEFEERPNEPFLFFAADKTDPGAHNLPRYLAFADVMNTPGLILSPNMSKGFRFVVMDVNYTQGDRVIELETPAEIYDLAALLRDTERYVVESVWSRATGEQAAAVATSRLHNIAGKYTGRDDPVMLVRVQMNFPATGEVLATYSIGHYVAGCMRGSHQNAAHAGSAQLGDQLLRWPAAGQLRGLRHASGQVHRSVGFLRPPVLGSREGQSGGQGNGYASSGVFRGSHATDVRAGIYGDHGQARRAREALFGSLNSAREIEAPHHALPNRASFSQRRILC